MLLTVLLQVSCFQVSGIGSGSVTERTDFLLPAEPLWHTHFWLLWPNTYLELQGRKGYAGSQPWHPVRHGRGQHGSRRPLHTPACTRARGRACPPPASPFIYSVGLIPQSRPTLGLSWVKPPWEPLSADILLLVSPPDSKSHQVGNTDQSPQPQETNFRELKWQFSYQL